MKLCERNQVGGDVFANGGMRATTGFNGAKCGQRAKGLSVKGGSVRAACQRQLYFVEGERIVAGIHGARNLAAISPDNWSHDQALLDRPGNDLIQLALLHDYQNNPPHYPRWQEYFRKHQPPTLITWGKNDPFFTEAGAKAYLKDLPSGELHLLDSGHFALEEDGPQIAGLIREFAKRIA